MRDLRPDTPGKVVGLRQVLRLADAGELSAVFIASDTDGDVRAKITEACVKNSIAIRDAQDMLALGAVCGIKVGASVVGLKVNNNS